MNTRLFIFIFLLTALNCFSQEESQSTEPKKSKITYSHLDFSIPLKANPFRDGESDYSENQSKNWFAPDGISGRIGYGIHYKKWISVGLHTGIDWKGSEKLVVAPVFGNLKFSPRFTKDDESRLFLSVGYGKTFALGRGNLSGNFVTGRLGVESFEDDENSMSFFIDISHYDIPLRNYTNGTGSISLGVAFNFY